MESRAGHRKSEEELAIVYGCDEDIGRQCESLAVSCISQLLYASYLECLEFNDNKGFCIRVILIEKIWFLQLLHAMPCLSGESGRRDIQI